MALINCPECGENISDKTDACIHCGFPFDYIPKDQVGCPECGKQISDKAHECISCGFKFNNSLKAPQNEFATQNQNYENEEKRSVIASIVFIFLKVLAGIILLYVILFVIRNALR